MTSANEIRVTHERVSGIHRWVARFEDGYGVTFSSSFVEADRNGFAHAKNESEVKYQLRVWGPHVARRPVRIVFEGGG